EQQTQLRGMNGHAYYRWILALTNTNPLKIVYTLGHSTEVSEPARMNFEADHYALSAQRYLNDVPIAPIPTFFMDDFTFFSNDDGWIKSNIRDYIAKSQIRCAAILAAAGNHERMVLRLYDPKPPPEYSYTHAYSAYSAVVQLYARSGQLPTADTLYSRGKIPSPQCQMGCNAIEDQHHIFVECLRYAPWRNTTANELITCTNDKLAEKGIEEIGRNDLLATVKSLFTDNTSVWPLQY
ncbi:hypothetical protein B0H14DRAFT_2299584, partial [Mycena olivaceomarginata]